MTKNLTDLFRGRRTRNLKHIVTRRKKTFKCERRKTSCKYNSKVAYKPYTLPIQYTGTAPNHSSQTKLSNVIVLTK